MANTSSILPMNLELPSTRVQELLDDIPENYAFNLNSNSISDSSDSVLPWMDSPVIDLNLLLDLSSTSTRCALLVGLFSVVVQLVNHGVESTLLNRLHDVGKEFFSLPSEEKRKHSRTMDCFEGYGCETVFKDHPIHWNDRLLLRILPVQQRDLKLWPEIVPKFRETLDEFSIGVKKVVEVTLKAIAKSLNLEESSFCSQYGEDGNSYVRFNFYPPCPYPDRVLGLKPHSDGSLITVLLQDKHVEGLQVLRDGQWYKVPVVPDALFINVGDLLEIMTNGKLKSPVHKAVVDKEKARMTVAVPNSVPLDKEIGPLSELIDEENPRLYKNVKNYIDAFLQHYARGERPIDSMKIQH